jgi:hypothetical protein
MKEMIDEIERETVTGKTYSFDNMKREPWLPPVFSASLSPVSVRFLQLKKL